MPDILDEDNEPDGELNKTQQAVCRDISARIAYWREESDLSDLEMIAVLAAVFGDEMHWQVKEERMFNRAVMDAMPEDDDEEDGELPGDEWKYHPD